MNVVTALSKLVKLKTINDRQFKDLLMIWNLSMECPLLYVSAFGQSWLGV
jgi:hypothetical protein